MWILTLRKASHRSKKLLRYVMHTFQNTTTRFCNASMLTVYQAFSKICDFDNGEADNPEAPADGSRYTMGNVMKSERMVCFQPHCSSPALIMNDVNPSSRRE